MPLQPGDKLGWYEILAPIGAGGMGEVYRAKDTKLDREVAVKVLPAALAQDPERLARFEREAKVLASLNHPNIAQIFGIEDSGGVRALVMELVPGETIKGPIPLEESLRLAAQIADALAAAHEKGITHRDLKPLNVMVTPKGVVKVLDFGLAAVSQPSAASEGDPSQSPTLTISPTRAGMILGTAAYMSPEQARGQTVDRRSDIWAFGVLLYEILTGKQLFHGDTVSDILASVLKEKPDLEQVPAKVRPLLRRCLEKEPTKRLQAIGDWELLLSELPTPIAQLSSAPRFRSWLPWCFAAFLLLALVLVSIIHLREKPVIGEPARFGIPLPEKTSFALGGALAVSPDGRKFVFGANDSSGTARLWLRTLDSLQARPLPDAEPAFSVTLFWSPDSRYVVYGDATKLKKIDISGGPPQTICEVMGLPRGGSWSADGTIVFGTAQGVMRVSAAGGTPSEVTARDPERKEMGHGYPVFLPDGRHFLYLRYTNEAGQSGVYAGTLDAKPQEQSARQLLAGASNLAYVPSADGSPGQLLFVRDGTLLARPFDAGKLELIGEAVPVAEQVSVIQQAAYGHFAASANGVLIYRSGTGTGMQLTLFDRQGRILGTVGEPGIYSSVTLSLDGTRAAVSRTLNGNQDIWIVDLKQGTTTRLTSDPAAERTAAFSPDGSRVAFVSDRGGSTGIYVKASSGAGNEELLFKSGPVQALDEWTRDGRFLIYQAISPQTGQDLWILPLEGDKKPFLFLQTQFDQIAAHVSPDGHWIAYLSNESGKAEVYVQGFTPSPHAGESAGAGKWLISRGGAGGMIHWQKDGKELSYLGSDGKVMAVDISTVGGFHAGTPQPLFPAPSSLMRLSNTPGIMANAAPDNDRFLFAVPAVQETPQGFTAVLNWQAGLKK